MRRRMTRTLLAAAAAGATAATLGLTAAGAASAASTTTHTTGPPSGTTPIYTNANCDTDLCAQSGYQASNRDFRFASAVIRVPTSNGVVDISPQFYVGLQDTNGWAHAGIEPCTGGGCPNGWEGFYEVFQDGTPLLTVHVPFDGVAAGDGVFFSIYFNSVGNAVRLVVTLPDGTTSAQTVAVNGSIYTAAVAEADWSNDDTQPIPTVPLANTRLTQFFQGRFTTLSGSQGTFDGPWVLSPIETTTNGHAPPAGTLISAPSYLWNDGNSYQGLPRDAFGVWLYNP